MDTNFAAYLDTYQHTLESAHGYTIQHTQLRPYMDSNFTAYLDTYHYTLESAHGYTIQHTQ